MSIGGNNTIRTDAIMEEVIEDSAPNTKRASMDEGNNTVTTPPKDQTILDSVH